MPLPSPVQLTPSSPEIGATLALLTQAFAYMEGRIDPPSSLGRMTAETLAQTAATQELWIMPGPKACVVLTPKPDHLYIGKLAVSPEARGMGLARRLIDLASSRARQLALPELQLQTRVELTENHATFQRLGFTEIARTAHPGYTRPTSITFAKPV